MQSTKGLKQSFAEKYLEKENIKFEENHSESGTEEEEIEMKKVKVKWNDFIKMKKKKFT